jgi:hypothetical protein
MPQGRIVGVVSGGVTIADFALAPRGPATGSIFGRVVDAPTLEPIAEALILVVGEGDTSLLQNVAPIVVLGRARTDADGRYRIHELPAGRVRVYALKRGYRIAGRGVEIPPGGAVEVNFRLQPVPMPMTGHLVGRVRDARTEAPIARAYVAILPDQASAFALSLAPGQPRFTLTDRNGHYAFRDVPIGHYRVVAIKRGYEAGVQRVTIEKGAIARAHFLLEPITNPHFGSLHGRATDAATGAPLPGVWVRVAGHDYEWLNDPDRFSTRTDENGEFLFEHLREGTYEVHFAKRGYEPARERVEIVAGMRTEIEVALKPIPHFGALEGHVTDALTGDPIPGAYVFIPLVDLPYSANPDNTIFTRTDDDGYYRIDDAPPGLQVVVAWHPGYFPDAQLATIVAGETTTLDFALIAWPPSPGGSVTVRAIDPATGRPIAGARVHLSTNDWIQPFSEWDVDWLATDDNGYATFASPPPGDWALIVSIEGYQPEMALTSEAVFGDFGPEIAGAVLLEMVKGESSAAARGLWIIYPQPPF